MYFFRVLLLLCFIKRVCIKIKDFLQYLNLQKIELQKAAKLLEKKKQNTLPPVYKEY